MKNCLLNLFIFFKQTGKCSVEDPLILQLCAVEEQFNLF